jgi:hypothetical protein
MLLAFFFFVARDEKTEFGTILSRQDGFGQGREKALELMEKKGGTTCG